MFKVPARALMPNGSVLVSEWVAKVKSNIGKVPPKQATGPMLILVKTKSRISRMISNVVQEVIMNSFKPMTVRQSDAVTTPATKVKTLHGAR